MNTIEIIQQKLDAMSKQLHALANTEAPINNTLIDRDELRKRLHLSEPTIIRWERKKRIPVIRLGRRVRYDWNEVVEHLKNSV